MKRGSSKALMTLAFPQDNAAHPSDTISMALHSKLYIFKL